MTPATRLNADPLLNAEDIAQWLGVSEAWVRQHASGRRRPIIPSIKMGKARRFRRDAVEQFLAECESQAVK